MRIAFISDVHGNLESLERALKIIGKSEVDEIYCLGDIIGYGPDPGECLEIIKQKCTVILQGNHDSAISDPSEYGKMNRFAQEALVYQKLKLSTEEREYLAGLPRVHEDMTLGLAMAHGSLEGDHFEYILDELGAYYNFREMRQRLLFVGHSHVPMHCSMVMEKSFVEAGGLPEMDRFRDPAKMSVSLDKMLSYIINPGSIGQPRDGNNPSFCIYDSEEERLEFIRYTYSVKKTVKKMAKAGLPEFLRQRLVICR